MAYFLNLFSIETWRSFNSAGASISGFSKAQQTQAEKNISEGDVFLCYIVKLSRWCGALRIISKPYIDDTPLFKASKDPFIVRFKVEPIVLLDFQHGLPVTEPEIWNTLTWTKDIEPGSVGWGANFQRSLRQMPDVDAKFLIELLEAQRLNPAIYELSTADQRALRQAATVQTESGELIVEIPTDEDAAGVEIVDDKEPEARESHQIQGLLAQIGWRMGFKIWLPKADRERVCKLIDPAVTESLLDQLPMNYNEATVRTIEQIDVLWLRGRSIARAFEVEHTTAIYSGLLRMADLVALQPDIQIPLHIVAPEQRRAVVLDQIKRPVFSLLETGPLAERCSLITYDGVRELAELPHLQHVTDSILEDFEVFTDF